MEKDYFSKTKQIEGEIISRWQKGAKLNSEEIVIAEFGGALGHGTGTYMVRQAILSMSEEELQALRAEYLNLLNVEESRLRASRDENTAIRTVAMAYSSMTPEEFRQSMLHAKSTFDRHGNGERLAFWGINASRYVRDKRLEVGRSSNPYVNYNTDDSYFYLSDPMKSLITAEAKERSEDWHGFT